MNEDIEEICTALETLATAVTNAWPSDEIVSDGVGGFTVAVTRHDLAQVATNLADDLKTVGDDELADSLLKFAQDVPRRLLSLQSNAVPQMFTGNSGTAIPAYLNTLHLLRAQLLPALGWQTIPDSKALPVKLIQRAKAAQVRLDELAPNIEQLGKQIEDIQQAHALADSLPIDLETLKEAREKLRKASTEATILEEKVKQSSLDSAAELQKMQAASAEAQKLVQQCEVAYQITTTKGLAGAFDQRAGRLEKSMGMWVVGLIVSLGIGSYIGALRLNLLFAALQNPNPSWAVISMQAVLSLLSVGAPLWFAWIATKQIGQRFRLAEDYAFKASVAKAYEGYRKEAARLDPAFEAQLFQSALTRLDEAPLRLVETEAHGSPWHELANSEGLRRVFNAAPEFQEKLMALMREGLATGSKKASPAVREAIKPVESAV